MRNVLNLLRKLEKAIIFVILNVGILMFASILVVTTLQIISRKVFNRPVIWAEDLTVFFFIWLTFLGAAVLYSKKKLLSVDTLVNLLPEKIRTKLSAVMEIVIFIFLACLMSYTVKFINIQLMLGNNLGGALGFPSYTATLAVLVSVFVMGISTIISIAEILVKKN